MKQNIYIEQLEDWIRELQDRVEENFQMYQVETRHAQKLMSR